MAIKTNELPGTRAVLRHSHMSSTKAREVLDLIRGLDYVSAAERLEYTERAAGVPIAKLLRSCAANAEHNEGLDPTELYVATCYADEGETMKRWRPRARGRATRIRKRTCHVTIVLARMPEEQLARRRARAAADLAERRARRVAGTRRRQAADEALATDEAELETPDTTISEATEAEIVESEGLEEEQPTLVAESPVEQDEEGEGESETEAATDSSDESTEAEASAAADEEESPAADATGEDDASEEGEN
jgi:large subunit ribosomal protein L22